MLRPEYQKRKQYTGDSSQGIRYPLVPLWGSKNEVVAPKWRTQNIFFGLVLELVIKFAILVLNISTKMAFSQNTFAMPLGTNCT